MKFLLCIFWMFIFIATATSLTGCAGIEYNAQTQTFKYWRVGNQKIEGLHVKKDSLDVSLDEQESKNAEIAEILRIVRELLEKYPL